MRFNISFLAFAALFAGITNAHMIMKTPTPFGHPDNSPLDAAGADFPCKVTDGVYDAAGVSNVMPIGVNQTLSFTGSAVHGGGSCQISLTTDKAPSKSTNWMVIHSIQGGCPIMASGNLPEDPNGSGASTFQFSIPEGISAGDYVLAWTWFNRIGNREMYMNCAPVTVTGGSKKRDAIADAPHNNALSERATNFPNMFVANIPTGNPCTLPEDKDVKFPNPGDSVQFAGEASNLMAAPAGCPASGGYPGSSSNAGSNTGGSPSAPVASSPVASSAPTTMMTSTVSAGSFLQPTGGPNASAPAAAPSAVAPPVSLSQPSAAPAAPSTAAPAAGGAPSTSGTSCSSPGTEVCSPDGTMIGMCDQMSHVVFTPVAAGTKCVNGNMVYARDYAGRHAHGHVRRHASGRW